jgi:MFS transporter, SP family, sugar:H+ symporter
MPLLSIPASADPADADAAALLQPPLTAHALLSIAVAASGGALFGYDLGVTGGVSTSDYFLEAFFPSVRARKEAAAAAAAAASSNSSLSTSSPPTSPYCTYDSHLLTLFTSSAFLAAALTTLFVAGATTRRAGRRFSLALSGGLFCLGIALNAGAATLGMLIAGRLLVSSGSRGVERESTKSLQSRQGARRDSRASLRGS